MSQAPLFLVFIVVGVILAAGVGAGASWALSYYRGQSGAIERKATIVISACVGLTPPAMFVGENVIQGHLGEVAMTVFLIADLIFCSIAVWRIVTASPSSKE